MAPDQVPPRNFPNTLDNCAIRQYARGMTTTPETQRDELARTLMDASAYAWEKDGSRHWPNMADMILAAGYRKTRTITTVEELDALPEDTIIRDAVGVHFDLFVDGNGLRKWLIGDHQLDPELPATVLWEAEA